MAVPSRLRFICRVLIGTAIIAFFVCLASYADGVFSDGQGNTMPYRVFLPNGYATGQDFPLILFLHGSTDGGSTKHIDNLINAARGGMGVNYQSVLLVPQVQVPPGNYSWNADVSENMAMGLLDLITSTYKINTRRIYLTGLSMGGFGTWDYIYDYPNKFAAAAPMAGGGDPMAAPVIKDIPIWAFHGAADGTVPVSYDDEMFDAIEAAGGMIEYSRPQGVGHGSPYFATFYDGTTYKNSKGQGLYQWMFAQSLPVPEPTSATLVAGALAFGLFCSIRRPWRLS
jgi:predicted peptidase